MTSAADTSRALVTTKKPVGIAKVVARDVLSKSKRVAIKALPSTKNLPVYIGDAAMVAPWFLFPWEMFMAKPSVTFILGASVSLCAMALAPVFWFIHRNDVKKGLSNYYASVAKRSKELE